MAEELGAAVLRVTVDTRQAVAALDDFRNKFSAALANVGKIDLGKADFSGLVQQATQAGAQAGKAITAGIEAATKKTKELKFLSFQQALDFTPKNSIKGLEEYARALQKLRDQTSLSVKGTQQLTDRLGAIQAALAQARTTTAQAIATQREFNNSLEKTRLKRVAEEAKQQANALKALEASQRAAVAANEAAAASSRAAAKAAAEQRKAYLDLAKASIGAVGGVASGAAGAAGALGKGAIGAVRTGVKVGRAAYGIGAELGILEEAKPGVLNALLKSTLDRFAFLGKQAQTTRGLILRTLEGVGAGAGLIELARNADLLRESLKALSVTAKVTDASVSAFAKFGNYFATSGFGSVGPLKDLFKGFADLETGTAAITSFSDQLIQIGTKGLSGSVDAIEALVNGFGQLPPAAQAAALAAPAVFAVIAGPAGKQAEVQLRKLKALLDGLGTTSLNVEGQLRDALNAIAEQEGLLKRAPLALPSSDLLQQRLRDTGSRQPQRLEPGVLNAVNNAGLGIAEQYTRQLEAAARAVKSQRDQYIAVQAEASKLLETDLRRQQILNSIARQRAAAPGFGAASAANFGQVDPVDKAIRRNREAVAQAEERAQKRRDLLAQDLGDVQARRVAVQKSILKLEEAERAAASRRAQDALKQLQDTATTRERRQQAGQDRQAQLRAQDFERRLAAVQERNRAREDRRRRFGEAGSNALIGGAFPLLFGQGIGASIGGAAGGGLGGFAGGQLGFGLSLLGTAVGAQFDLAAQKAGTLASALSDPIGKFSELQQAALLSSKAVERQAEALIAAGREGEASAIIQRDLANSYGSLDGAKALAGQTDQLQRSWSQLSATFAAFAAGPLAAVISQINRVLGGGSGGGVGGLAFENRIKDINKEFGSDAANRVRGEQARIAAQEFRANPFKTLGNRLISSLTFGIAGRSIEQNQQEANARALANAKAAGLETKEQLAITAALEKSRQLREQIYSLSLKQVEADAADNKSLQDSVKFQSIQATLRERIGTLQSTGKLFTQTGPNSFELSPEAVKARQEAETQRKALVEASKQSAAVSERELNAARQLVGLEGDRLTIKQEQQKVDEAQRLFAQADSTFRQRFSGVDPATLVGAQRDEYQTLFNDRATAENNLTRIRLDSYARIQQAEQALANERIAVERQLSAAREGLTNAQQFTATPTFSNGEAGPARGAVQQVQAIRQTITQARQAAEDAARNVAQAIARGVNGDALAQLQKVAQAAGLDLKKELLLGSDALRSAARQAADALKQAQLELSQALSDPQGLNQYLSAQAGQNRTEQALQSILPAFRSAQRSFERLTGYNAPEFQGSTAGVLDAVQQFIQRVDREQRAIENVQLNGRSLESINSELTTSSNNLANQIAALAAKNWSVNVNVAPNGSVSSSVGALNGTF